MARGGKPKILYPGGMGGTRGNLPGRERPRGNIEQLPSGSLRVRVYAGKDILTGGDLYLKRTIPAGPDAWDEAERVREEFVSQVEQGRHPRTNATISQMVDKHLASADLERRVKQTLEGYARKHIHTQPIGKRSINEADNQDVQALETFYADLRRCRDHCDRKPTVRHYTANQHRCTKQCRKHVCKPLAKWTVRKIHFLISAAYQSAIRWEWVFDNPTRRAKVPAPPQAEPDPPTAEQAAALINECWRWDDLGPFVWLAMTTGARRGELCALRWERLKAIHAERGQHDCIAAGCRWVLDIRRGIAQDLDSEIYEKDTKSHQRRLIAIDPETVAVLAEHRLRCTKAAKAIGVTLTDKHFMFPDSPGGTVARKPNSWSDRYERCAQRLGIDTTIKNLRHYSATELIIGGVDIRTVAGRLGHSGGGTTTLKVYAAWVAAADQLASTVLLNRMPPRPSSASTGGDLALQPRKVHEQLAADLCADWVSGDLAAGTEITVKGLIRSHGVTNHVAYRTVIHLKNKGVLDVRNGHRSVVLPYVEADDKAAAEDNTQAALDVAPPTSVPVSQPAPASVEQHTAPAQADEPVAEAARREAVDLEVVHRGQSLQTYRTQCDPNNSEELLELLLDAIRRTGGQESDVRDYELVVHYAGERGVVTRFIAPLHVARALRGVAA
jgi:integrase